MKIMIQSHYLVFPVYTHATEKQLTFSQKGKTVFQVNLKLDNASPDFFAYIDVSLFKNEILELSVSPEMPIRYTESDHMAIDNLYHEAIRPQAHFTPKSGWMGVPDALIRSEGNYVLLYPHNPAETEPGNGHWGYAVSKDLVHWTEEFAPVFPQEGSIVLRGYERVVFDTLRKLRFLGEWEHTEKFTLSAQTGERKIVRFLDNGKYLVGDMKNGVFAPTQKEKTLRYGGTVNAGVMFDDLSTDRVIRMDWDGCKTARFCGQMSIPMEISLEKRKDEYVLVASPVKELQSLYKNTNRYEDLVIPAGGAMDIPLADSANMIYLRGESKKTGTMTLHIFGREILADFENNRISAGGAECPLSITGDCVDLTVLVDRMGMEIYADGGRIYMSALTEEMFMDRNLLSFSLHCDEEYLADLIEIHALESIW
ncbi:MAG: hypothetical protein IJD59_03635 [Clostridia bacterium]|nr:hypothetical protein [Clostridia bacterium]